MTQPRLLVDPPIELLYEVSRRGFERQLLQRSHGLAEQAQFLPTNGANPEVHLYRPTLDRWQLACQVLRVQVYGVQALCHYSSSWK
jgi:hypothetical protein